MDKCDQPFVTVGVLEREVAALKAKCAEMATALGFYATQSNYARARNDGTGAVSSIDKDAGRLARVTMFDNPGQGILDELAAKDKQLEAADEYILSFSFSDEQIRELKRQAYEIVRHGRRRHATTT